MAEIIVIMGPQGAGKGTQARRLADDLGLPTIATGDILRQVSMEGTDLARKVKETQEAGNLVSDDILAQIIEERLGQEDCEPGCLLDGFPRTIPQAEFLDQVASKRNLPVHAVSIEVPREMLWKRLTGRRSCTVCGTIYNVYFNPPKTDAVCDLEGGRLMVRKDDNAAAIEKRLAEYDEKTRPVISYYQNSGRFNEIDGTGTPEDVHQRLLGALDEARRRTGSN